MKRKKPRFRCGQVVGTCYKDDFRKVIMRRWKDRWEYCFDRGANPLSPATTWYEESLLHRLTIREFGGHFHSLSFR